MNTLIDTIRTFFKRLFPPAAVSHRDSPFPDIDRDSLSRKLEVVERAKEEGARNLPDSHSVRAASYEQTIVQALSTIADDTSQKLTTILKSFAQTAQLTNTQAYQKGLENAVESYESNVEKLLLSAEPEMDDGRTRFDQCKQELSEFRRKHGLRRRAEYPESSILTWALLCLIVVLESGMNGYFFAEGSRSGLLGGFGQAAMISIVNVAIAAAVALLPARLISHRNIGLKAFGILTTIAYFVFLIAGLLFLTLYRDAFINEPDGALQAVFESVREGNWKPSDINSYLFFALTFLFAVGAFLKVLYSDDLYFGYGRVTKKAEAARDKVLEDRDTLLSSLEQAKKQCLAEIEHFSGEIEYNVNNIHDAVESHNQLLSQWDSFGQTLVTYHDALVADYRTANRNARSNTPPDWFRVITPFEISHFQPRVERCESPARLSELLNDYKQLEAESRATLDKMHNDKIDRVHDILALKRNSTTNSFVAKSAETNAA